MKNYTNVAYAQSRLVGTIVRVKGKAAYIDQITAKRISYTDWVTGGAEEAKIEDMDITPVPLGYCNTMKVTPYLVRYPVRQDWKQGLRHKTLKTICNHDIKVTSEMIPWADVFKTINGEFPKFEEVLKIIHDNRGVVRSMAYSRDFAIYSDKTVWYKEQFAIGTVEDIDTTDGIVSIKEEFEWVRDAFEASVVW